MKIGQLAVPVYNEGDRMKIAYCFLSAVITAFLVVSILAHVGYGAGPKMTEAGSAGQSKPSADLRPFMDTYFSSWSSRDIQAYRSHFNDTARIMLIDNGKVLSDLALDSFLEQQASYLTRAKGPLSEQMTSFTADEDSHAATVVANWMFKGEGQTSFGVDRFTVIRDPNRHWKIVTLVWYALRHQK